MPKRRMVRFRRYPVQSPDMTDRIKLNEASARVASGGKDCHTIVKCIAGHCQTLLVCPKDITRATLT